MRVCITRNDRSATEHKRQVLAIEEKVQLLTRASDGCADLLEKRQGPGGPKYSEFARTLSKSGTVYVSTGDQKFKSFIDGPVTMGSDGFDGCIGIVISSPRGGIVAHYTATEDGTENGKKALTELIRKHKDSFRPDETEAHVFANVRGDNHDEFVNKNQKDTFIELIKDELDVDAEVERYLQLGDMIDLEDIDDENIDLVEEQLEQLKGGAMLLHNKGGGLQSKISFVNIKLQTGGDSCRA